MSCDTASSRTAIRRILEDEVAALTLQLEEIVIYLEKRKGKYPATSPPDAELAVSTFEDEIRTCINSLNDLKLARSVAYVVNIDGEIIPSFAREENQAQEDRRLALQISDDTELETPLPYTSAYFNTASSEECFHWITKSSNNSATEINGPGDDASPSMTYAERQQNALESECCICLNHLPTCEIVYLECKGLYCTNCLKRLFMRAIKDQPLLPPICCRQHIPLLRIAAELSSGKLEEFHRGQDLLLQQLHLRVARSHV